jgi:hypothetical protein
VLEKFFEQYLLLPCVHADDLWQCGKSSDLARQSSQRDFYLTGQAAR